MRIEFVWSVDGLLICPHKLGTWNLGKEAVLPAHYWRSLEITWFPATSLYWHEAGKQLLSSQMIAPFLPLPPSFLPWTLLCYSLFCPPCSFSASQLSWTTSLYLASRHLLLFWFFSPLRLQDAFCSNITPFPATPRLMVWYQAVSCSLAASLQFHSATGFNSKSGSKWALYKSSLI